MTLRRFAFTQMAAAGLMLAQTTTTGTVSRQSSFPPVGLASSETAQVNVTNFAGASSTGTAASCTGSVSFINPGGTAIGTAMPFTVTGGQTFSANLPFANAGASDGRTVVRAVVSLTITLGSGVPCALETSFETFDTATGVTHVHLSEGVRGGGPGGYGR